MKKTLKIFVVLLIVAVFASTLFACSKTKETITISFVTNGGLEVPSVTINVGDDLDVPTPVREGYAFKGWCEDTALQTPFNGSATYNLTLYAKWEANQNTLSFDANGGTGAMSNIVIATDATQKLPANTLEKSGYIFLGWATTATGDVVYANEASYTMGVQSQYTLYAKWALALNLNFDANGGTGIMNAIKVTAEHAFTIPQNVFTKSGYVFAGWATTAGGDAQYADQGTMTAGTTDITLYAVWVDINTLYTRQGDYILFGEYPQSLATSEAVAAMGTTADAKGYYTSTFDNAKYAKVTATPLEGNLFGGKDNSTTINAGEDYYFKLEPIKWRILAQDNGTYTLLADNILDTLAFDDNSVYWHESQIREWLNSDFFGQAFNNTQKTLVQNSNIITIYDEYNDVFDVNYETSDYVFLPSFEDMINVDYGFTADWSKEETSRQAVTSEYVRAKGIEGEFARNPHLFGNGFYLTRSYNDEGNIQRVQGTGWIEDTSRSDTGNGIRPMMVLVIP